MAERAKKLPKSKWVLLCCGVILIAACAVGTAVWFTRPPTLEEMTAHMPENPSEAWMQRYVDLAVADPEFRESVFSWNGNQDAWWAWFQEQPLVDEMGGGQYFTVKWQWAVPRQYPEYQGLTQEEFQKAFQQPASQDYMQYYVDRYRNDGAVHRRIEGLEEDPQGWWEWFDSLPLYDEQFTHQYGVAYLDVLVPLEAAYSGWHGVHE